MMKSFIALATAVAPVLANIPPAEFNFPSAPGNSQMSVAYTFNGNTTLVQVAQLFGSNITRSQPLIALDPAKSDSVRDFTGQYVVLMVDPDAPNPENPTRRFILHWLATGLTAAPPAQTNSQLAGQRLLTNSTAATVPYAPPGPPPMSAAHRYMFYAFQQPAGFALPTGFNASNRAGFNVDSFVRDTNLGSPVAANYLYVSRQASVPGTFIAMPGGEFPGGNGAAVFAGSGSGSGSGNGNGGGQGPRGAAGGVGASMGMVLLGVFGVMMMV